MREAAHEIAKEYGFPSEAEKTVLFYLEFAVSVLDLPNRPTIKERERDARRRLKEDPDDEDAEWDLREIENGRRYTVCDSTQTVMVGGIPKYALYTLPSDKNRRSRDNVDHQLHAATYFLEDLWEAHHGKISLYDGTGKAESWKPDAKGMHPSRGIEFLSAALRAAGAYPRDCQPRAIRHRLHVRRRNKKNP